jgi:hypothetical protein
MCPSAVKRQPAPSSQASEDEKPALRVERVDLPTAILEAIKTNLQIAKNASKKIKDEE